MISKNSLFLLAKILFTLGSIFVVIQSINVNQLIHYVKQVDYYLIILSLLSLNIGQIISALRLRYYIQASNISCSKYFAISLYYIGMLFNLILPGGVGGDGYKMILIKRIFKNSFGNSVRIILSGRANGLFALLIHTYILALFSDIAIKTDYLPQLLTFGIVICCVTYFIFSSTILKEQLNTTIVACWYSLFVQLFAMISAYFLFIGLGVPNDKIVNYIFLFMCSSVVSVIPISIAGIGLRELSFLYGSNMLGIDPELGIGFSLLYFTINSIISLSGSYFYINLKVRDQNI